MENSWSSLASIGSLVVPHTSAGLPGFPEIDHGDEDGSPFPKIPRMAEHVQNCSLPREMDTDFKEEAGE